MKYLMLVCEQMADEPLADLEERTPLEAAKTPFMDLLAKKGQLGKVSFTPRELPATPDIACLSLLGFDPRQFYTGVAPLETIAMGIPLNDNEVAFRCDLVTVLDDHLVDVSASLISDREAGLLIGDLNKKLSSPKVKFYPGDGYKNILVVSDPEVADHLDELDCVPPPTLVGQKFVKYLPKGKGAALLTNLMDQSKEILEHHEINRVRIDLHENPANMIWPWGQGKRPKTPSFAERFHLEGAVISDEDFMKGIAKTLNLAIEKNIEKTVGQKDFVLLYMAAGAEFCQARDLKSKIRFIEHFDATVVGPVLKILERWPDHRLCICADYAASLTKKASLHDPVPFLMEGKGIEPDGAEVFNEKTAFQTKRVLDEGHRFMEFFLGK